MCVCGNEDTMEEEAGMMMRMLHRDDHGKDDDDTTEDDRRRGKEEEGEEWDRSGTGRRPKFDRLKLDHFSELKSILIQLKSILILNCILDITICSSLCAVVFK